MAESSVGSGGRWRAFAVCLLAGFVTLLDVSVINVALPSIQAGLDLSAGQVSWSASGYTLCYGLVLVPAGALGDQLGRRRILLVAVSFFALVSLACGLASSGNWLVATRLLQGLAAGLLMPQVPGLMLQLFGGSERGKVTGVFSAMLATATAAGPLVGGLLIHTAGQAGGWRWVFLVNVPIAALVLTCGSRWLPRDPRRAGRVHLDLVGVALLGSAVTALILPLIAAEQRDQPVPWYLLGVSAVLLACFVTWQQHRTRRGLRRLVNLGLLRQRDYAVSALISVCYFAGYIGIPFVVAMYFQQGLGYSALAAGVVSTPFALGAAAGAAPAGRVVYRVGRRLIVAGLVLLGLGTVGAAAVISHHSDGPVGLLVAGPLLLAGAGNGLVTGSNMALGLRHVPAAEGGTAAATLQTVQRIGMTIGIAIITSLYFGPLETAPGNYLRAANHGLIGSAAVIALTLLVTIVAALTTRTRRLTDVQSETSRAAVSERSK